jgi:hypothetical protein
VVVIITIAKHANSVLQSFLNFAARHHDQVKT